MGKQALSAISGALFFGVVLFALVFFWKNPFRVGEITIATAKGPSMTLKVANTDEISELIRGGLENEQSADALINSLLSIIEHLPPSSELGKKLVELAELRHPPFSWSSVPVKVVYDSKVPQGLAAVCEQSGFTAKNIVVYVLGSENDLLYTAQAYADPGLTFPCPETIETVRLNSMEVREFQHNKILAKRTL